MITAEELSKNYTRLRSAVALKDLSDFAIEFAKLHVTEALNNIKKETQLWDDCPIVPYEKIVYPLENIK